MSHIIKSISQLIEPEKSIGEILIDFYETMKSLEKYSNPGGRQATKIVMTIADLKLVFEQKYLVSQIEDIAAIIPFDLTIKETASKYSEQFNDHAHDISSDAFFDGAKWMRKILTGR